MKVLWLASSYPSKLHPYNGDFVQRHARATALFCEIEVLHIVKDDEGIITNDVKEIIVSNKRLTEKNIYYKPLKTSIRIVDRFLSSLKYKKIARNFVKNYMLQNGKPAYVHVHIAMKAGLTALWFKRKYKVPYLLTEHWGGYLDEAKPNIRDYNFIYKYYWKKIITQAKACSFVSAYLQNHITTKYKIKNSVVIPNVVDTDIFYPAKKLPVDKIRFIHVSTMLYQKNPEAILQALGLLKNSFSFEMYFYGPVLSSIITLVADLGLQEHVLLKGEVPQEELSRQVQQSDALILYSRFETFGCVLIEANACGIPVIVSDLKVFHEIIAEAVNGLFVEGENPVALAEKLKQFILQRNTFDKTAIARYAAEEYNLKRVGQQFLDLYKKVDN